MTDYVLTVLVKGRAELAGEIEATHDPLRKMIESRKARLGDTAIRSVASG